MTDDLLKKLIGTDHPKIQEILLSQKAFEVIKKAETLVRLPKKQEIGKVIDTYVKKNDIIVKESSATIMGTSVIARNPIAISDGMFNEWTMNISTFVENYGQVDLSTEFQAFKKQITNKVVEIDQEILAILGSRDLKSAQLAISWDEGGMLVHKGDFLFDAGYAVDKREFYNTYEKKFNL